MQVADVRYPDAVADVGAAARHRPAERIGRRFGVVLAEPATGAVAGVLAKHLLHHLLDHLRRSLAQLVQRLGLLLQGLAGLTLLQRTGGILHRLGGFAERARHLAHHFADALHHFLKALAERPLLSGIRQLRRVAECAALFLLKRLVAKLLLLLHHLVQLLQRFLRHALPLLRRAGAQVLHHLLEFRQQLLRRIARAEAVEVQRPVQHLHQIPGAESRCLARRLSGLGRVVAGALRQRLQVFLHRVPQLLDQPLDFLVGGIAGQRVL